MILKLRRTVLIFCLLISGHFLLAQPGDPGGDPDVPITGIELLIAGGSLFGLKRLVERKKSK